MRDCSHRQMFTVFGGSYVAEDHGFAAPKVRSKRSAARVAAAVGLLVLGITTATAVTKNIRFQASDSVWGQSPRALSISVPGMGGFEQALY